MQLLSTRSRSTAGRTAQRSHSRTVCSAISPFKVAQQAVFTAAAAAGVAATLLLSPLVAPAQAAEKLADIVREQYAFIDKNQDGIVTQAELQRGASEYAEEIDFSVPSNDSFEFAIRLFDLDQDGVLTTDELLTSIVLDGSVNEDERVVDEDVYKTFDKNGDKFVDLSEFKSTTPDLGAGSDAVKNYVFNRVDRLVSQDGKLDQEEFVNALTLFRNTVLGY